MTRAHARQTSTAPEVAQDVPSRAGGNASRAIALADAIRRCRWIAIELGAQDFAFCTVGSAAESGRLVPCFDSDHLVASASTRLLDDGIGEQLLRQVRHSTAPCWWADEAEAEAFAGLVWTNRLEPTAGGGRGIAFPVYSDCGQAGLFVFAGAQLAPSSAALHDLHGRCFQLFNSIAGLARGRAAAMPSMSRREIECLKLTSRGYTSEEIAKELKLSVHTANQYLTQTTQKLNAVNRMHAVAKALRLGLID
ncbi:helix-turn-helix transcriptional regulator [Aminobacter sp. MET-1]|uniref:helix-turn-helix transcriptional regulator n=1 Tax=Aminobacter sp. MET-1 TaxID=2951085 RepID=UPI002269C05C|nr:helix-turn-helix transcriptional regulator [Aminobacter sp. MET-1]MCX8569857.1 helix-turn-helix transcriptional regulator [Aminobacter sp. MET-1]